MDVLSLLQPEPPPPRRLTRTEALLASFAVHLMLLLLALFLPQHLPAPLLAFLTARPPRTEPAPEPAAENPAQAGAAPAQPKRPPAQPQIPLTFAYVRLPHDTASAKKNPKAPLLSDKNRQARQPVPTPPKVTQFSIDPHAEGNSIERVEPDPSRPEGPESPKESETASKRGAGGGGGGSESAQRLPGNGGSGASPEPLTPEAPGGTSRAGAGAAGGVPTPALPPGSPGEGAGEGVAGTLRDTLTEMQSGEYKFAFRNPAYLRGGSYGSMSFDTQDFPWGDYARKVYLAIRNNWLARIPLAAREGIRGFVCWRFLIEKNGVISQILSTRPSAVPPFDKAASDAIRASGPLPPLPEGFPKDREGATFCFYYNMYPGEAE